MSTSQYKTYCSSSVNVFLYWFSTLLKDNCNSSSGNNKNNNYSGRMVSSFDFWVGGLVFESRSSNLPLLKHTCRESDWLLCWSYTLAKVLHQRWISGNVYYACLFQVQIRLLTLSLKPRGIIHSGSKGISIATEWWVRTILRILVLTHIYLRIFYVTKTHSNGY